MYVCICNNVNERKILQAIADGANSWKKLVRRLKVSTTCGKCKDDARAFFNRHIANQPTATGSTTGQCPTDTAPTPCQDCDCVRSDEKQESASSEQPVDESAKTP